MNKETRNIAINEMKHNLKTSWFPYLEEEISDRGVKWWCVGAVSVYSKVREWKGGEWGYDTMQ